MEGQSAREANGMERMIACYCVRLQIFVFAFFLLCAGAVDMVYAAEGELPCAEEIAKHCKEVKPGGGRILNCLDEHQKELSDSCRKKLEESKKKLMEAQQACTGDMEKFCKDVQPGEGRILRCLREHTHELSSACRKMTDNTEERMQEKKEPRQ
jgi:hypothetical protein